MVPAAVAQASSSQSESVSASQYDLGAFGRLPSNHICITIDETGAFNFERRYTAS